jgi:hypothetical protein
MDRPPLRVGVLHDYPRPDGGAAFEWAVRLGIGEVESTGRLPAPVTFVHESAHGGPDHPIAPAFARLVDQGVLAILGPALTAWGCRERRWVYLLGIGGGRWGRPRKLGVGGPGAQRPRTRDPSTFPACRAYGPWRRSRWCGCRLRRDRARLACGDVASFLDSVLLPAVGGLKPVRRNFQPGGPAGIFTRWLGTEAVATQTGVTHA